MEFKIWTMTMFAMTADDGWHPGIGDPTFMGWFTVVAYFIAVVLCWRCAVRARRQNPERAWTDERVFWVCFTVVLTCLGINKQLDLQTWFTEVGRNVASAQGWYERRQIVQVTFIGIITVVGFGSFLVFCWILRRIVRQQIITLAGGIYLISFVLVRAASFHHFDELIGRKWGDLKLNWVLELGGIAWVALGALCTLRTKGRVPADVIDSGSRSTSRI